MYRLSYVIFRLSNKIYLFFHIMHIRNHSLKKKYWLYYILYTISYKNVKIFRKSVQIFLQWVLSFQISHKMYQLSRSPPKSVDIQPNIHTFPHNLHSLKKKKRCTHFPTKCTNFIIIIKNLKKNYRANHIMYHLFQKIYTLSHVMH